MAYSSTQLQLTHVLQELYRSLGAKMLVATGGSTTTTIDTKLAEELADGNEDDIYNGGTLIVVQDTGGLAPEGEIARISDYEASTTTITHETMTAAIASGDRVMVAPIDYPLADMIEVVNDALRDLPEVPQYDTSITTAANQTEYDLPLSVKGGRILRVEIQGLLNDSNDNQWRPVPDWEENFAQAGVTGKFTIPQYPIGYTVRITYRKWHPRVKLYDDYINEFLHPRLVNAAVLAYALQWRNNSNAGAGGADPSLLSLEQKAWSQYDRAKIEHAPAMPKKKTKGMPQWSGFVDSEEYTVPTS